LNHNINLLALALAQDGPRTLPAFHNHGRLEFTISCWVQFASFDYSNYPMIATTSENAFQFHGLGPTYGADQGKLGFYLQTTDNIGSYGRGTGQVRSREALTPGQWYFVVVEKGLTTLSIVVDGQRNTVYLDEQYSAGDFEMKETGDTLVNQGTGDKTLFGFVSDFKVDYDGHHFVNSEG
jgi:hypothetical protein